LEEPHTAGEKRVNLALKEERELSASVDTLAPDFASRYSGREHRWANTVTLSVYGPDKIAPVLPFNTFDRSWPRLVFGGGQTIIGSEGWVFLQKYKNWNESLRLLSKEDAIIGSLKQFGIDAQLSEPGQIAKQMLDHLGGLWGVYLLADPDTLSLLNKMAGGLRRRSNDVETVEESFERRSAPLKDWIDHLSRRRQREAWSRLELSQFTKRNVIRLGLETDCPHCQAINWHSLTGVDYTLTCERCLNQYEFPQAGVKEHNRNWYYRVVGPFSVPDYGRGSYSALLTLRVLDLFTGMRDKMTFSTAMNLAFDEVKAEADFVAWRRPERHGSGAPPQLLLGETKSMGQGDLIKTKTCK
jgi:hypothetical protein